MKWAGRFSAGGKIMGAVTETGGRAFPRLHWGPVITGVLVALAAHIVLGLVGAAIGFAAVPADSKVVGAGAASWGLITPFVATLLGAWVAVKTAAQFDEVGSNLHGILVWCIGLVAGALFLAGTMASGAMTAGTAASGSASAVRRVMAGGEQRADAAGPRARANAGQAQDEAGKVAAAVAGGAAMAAIAGLLGAVAGAGIARSRREGRGLGWRVAIQRDVRRREGAYSGAGREPEVGGEAPYPTHPATPGEAARPDLGPPDPYRH